MGDTCTRGCRFCAVKTSKTPLPLDIDEPSRVAEAISRWGLGYIVLTSVDRDDVLDGGSSHISKTISLIKKTSKTRVEALVPDFQGDLNHVEEVAKKETGLDVFAHNIETVERTTPMVRDRRAKYRQSLSVLKKAKETREELLTKTSIMLGCGETDEEVRQTLKGQFSVPFFPLLSPPFLSLYILVLISFYLLLFFSYPTRSSRKQSRHSNSRSIHETDKKTHASFRIRFT